MANPSPGNSITLRVEAPSSFTATSELAAAVGAAGAAITALDVTESHHETLVVDVTCNTTDDDHAARVKDALNALDGVTVRNVSDRTSRCTSPASLRLCRRSPCATGTTSPAPTPPASPASAWRSRKALRPPEPDHQT